MGDFLCPERDEHRRAFGGLGPDGVNFAQAVGQRRGQVVQKFFTLFPLLLLHIVGHHGGKVVVLVLPPLSKEFKSSE
jgi:hypothetical protein